MAAKRLYKVLDCNSKDLLLKFDETKR